jgi:hypothetical protein
LQTQSLVEHKTPQMTEGESAQCAFVHAHLAIIKSAAAELKELKVVNQESESAAVAHKLQWPYNNRDRPFNQKALKLAVGKR